MDTGRVKGLRSRLATTRTSGQVEPSASYMDAGDLLQNKFRVENKLREALEWLVAETGMPIFQPNGQRCMGPPLGYSGPPPLRGSEVYVGLLPHDCFEPEFLPFFLTTGRIYNVRLLMNFSGLNRGYAFVQYYTAEEARKAITTLNGFEIRPGKKLIVVRSTDNRHLLLTEVCGSITLENVYMEIRNLSVGLVRVLRGGSDKRIDHLLLEYDSHRNASLARSCFMTSGLLIRGKEIGVDWAPPWFDGQNLLLKNLHPSITNQMLRNIFNNCSANGVNKIKRDGAAAVIHFESIQQADMAFKSKQSTIIHGHRIHVSMQEGWDLPVPSHSNRKSNNDSKKSTEQNRNAVKPASLQQGLQVGIPQSAYFFRVRHPPDQ